jgi:hypothetical protein
MSLQDTQQSDEKRAGGSRGQSDEDPVDLRFAKAQIGLVVRFAAIVGLAVVIALMFSRMWGPQVTSYAILYDAANTLIPSEAHPMEPVACFGIGLLGGALLLFTVDSRKRYQGALLVFGVTSGVGTLAAQGILIPNIDFTDPWNLGVAVLGLTVGLGVEYPSLRRYWADMNRFQTEDIVFPRIGIVVFSLLSALVLGGLAQSAIAGTWHIIPDVPASLGFVYLLLGFVRYDSAADVAVVGPRQSGKSLLLLGLFLTYRGRGVANGGNGYMEELIQQADSMTANASSAPDFPIANTEDLNELSFSIVSGRYFPKRINIRVTDHTGELFGRASEYLQDGMTLAQNVNATLFGVLQSLGIDVDNEQREVLFFHGLANSDVVALLLDMERLMNGNIRHVNRLKHIGSAARNNGAEVLIVATKCDLVNNVLPGDIELLNTPAEFGLFEKEITDHLTQTLDSVDALVDEVGDGRIYPVYYQTEEAEDTTLRPRLDELGNLQHRGTDEVADIIETRL